LKTSFRQGKTEKISITRIILSVGRDWRSAAGVADQSLIRRHGVDGERARDVEAGGGSLV
jgi:hypothetical protein